MFVKCEYAQKRISSQIAFALNIIICKRMGTPGAAKQYDCDL